MKFSARKSYTFFPDINGNLDLPEGERLSVEIIRPTAEERGDVTYLEYSTKTETLTPLVTYRFDSKSILNRCVGKIENLAVENYDSPGETRNIRNGKELAKESFYGMGMLVDAICTEVCTDIISNTQKKISESDSASSGTDGTSGN